MGSNGFEWARMDSNGLEWTQKVVRKNELEWARMDSNGLEETIFSSEKIKKMYLMVIDDWLGSPVG